ncbi:VOC family protein [Streptomyces sp. NPDC046805]|uniref:VOC family protein n=1 Tax=Streptomyces sp. NPDC046805 TaxID=3155134 RepID=UPI0033FCA565
MGIRWTYAFVDRPLGRLDDACTFWTAATGTRRSEPRGERGEFVTLVPDGADPCVKVQGVVSGDGGAHLDFCVDDVEAFTESARERGAGMVAAHDGWAVLRSPAGQLFCVLPWHGESARPPVVAGSRLDQVCLDIPPSAYEAEVAFWAGLTGWELLASALPEFRALTPPPGLPVRILLQRLAEERPGSAHLDIACADIEASRARHEDLGAVYVTDGPDWTVMRDPAGGTYCLTGRDPERGRMPSSSAVRDDSSSAGR